MSGPRQVLLGMCILVIIFCSAFLNGSLGRLISVVKIILESLLVFILGLGAIFLIVMLVKLFFKL
jgi:hypothetical protein